MKVENMTSPQGNKVTNQFIITDIMLDTGKTVVYFQSYDSIIARKEGGDTILDKYKWDYSKTTGKYRNQFLGETKAETQKKIDSGEYILTDLN